ncbi:hypothetical protein DMUE_2672 [Dictyocoela muelleri]|nr:hypothetical protein DMUE_2672 [Dictyocoela muelleri]
MPRKRMRLYKPKIENYNLDPQFGDMIISIFKQRAQQKGKHPHIVEDPYYSDYLKPKSFYKLKIDFLKMNQLRKQFFYFLNLSKTYKINQKHALKLLFEIEHKDENDNKLIENDNNFIEDNNKIIEEDNKLNYDDNNFIEDHNKLIENDNKLNYDHNKLIENDNKLHYDDSNLIDDSNKSPTNSLNNSSNDQKNFNNDPKNYKTSKELSKNEKFKIILKDYISTKERQIELIQTIMKYMRIIYLRAERSYWNYKEIEHIVKKKPPVVDDSDEDDKVKDEDNKVKDEDNKVKDDTFNINNLENECCEHQYIKDFRSDDENHDNNNKDVNNKKDYNNKDANNKDANDDNSSDDSDFFTNDQSRNSSDDNFNGIIKDNEY